MKSEWEQMADLKIAWTKFGIVHCWHKNLIYVMGGKL